MSDKKENQKYALKPEFKGKTCWTIPPKEKRKGGGKFVLDDLSQKDLGYLFEVIGYEGVIKM